MLSRRTNLALQYSSGMPVPVDPNVDRQSVQQFKKGPSRVRNFRLLMMEFIVR